MVHLTTPESVKLNTRPVSTHLDNDRINIYIEEAEQINIKPRIGDALFVDLLKWIAATSEEKETFPDAYKTLIEGGEYNSTTICGEQTIKTFKGLQVTLDYYVYAKLIKNNSSNVTRFGGDMRKRDDYSVHADLREKLVAEKDALTVADSYMADCIDFLVSQPTITLFTRPGKVRNRLRITVIGD